MSFLDESSLWESVLTELELSLSGANYQTWFKGKTKIVSIKNGLVDIGCSSAFNKSWVEERYGGQLKEIINRITAKANDLTFSVFQHENLPTLPRKKTLVKTAPLFEEVESDGLTERLKLSNIAPTYSFSNFLVNSSNQLAFAVAKAVSDSADKVYNPLLLHGGVGVGKTHLIQALGHSMSVRNPNAKILYVSSETFTNDLVDAIFRKQTLSFREKYRNLDLLLVDDIQFIAGRESTQEQFFHTFNELLRKGAQVVMTCDRNPTELDNLQERLKSRFVGGMVAKIEYPDLELREAVLRSKLKNSSISLSEDLIKDLASSAGPSIREVEGALLRIEAISKLTSKEITKELLENVVGIQAKSDVTPGKLIEIIAEYFSISPLDVKGRTRSREALLPRQMAMYLTRKKLNLSFGQIGKIFGGKDHTTVLYSINKIEMMVEKNAEINRLLKTLSEKVFGG